MKTVLFTSFGRFGAYPANSSEIITKNIRRNRRMDGCWAIAENFPADIPDYNRGCAVLELAFHEGACAIIALGMASNRRVPTIETRAVNRIFHPVYCTPEQNGKPVDPTLSIDYELPADLSAWNVDRITHECDRAGLGIELSKDAGGFCCNHLMFQMIRIKQIYSGNITSIPWIFIHIPCSPEAVPEPSDEFMNAGKTTMTTEIVMQYLEIVLKGLPP